MRAHGKQRAIHLYSFVCRYDRASVPLLSITLREVMIDVAFIKSAVATRELPELSSRERDREHVIR